MALTGYVDMHTIFKIVLSVWSWYPPVGVFIAVLGLLGVLVPLFRDLGKIGKREKAIWTFMMFSLMLLEIRSIYLDRNVHDREQKDARAEQLKEFSKIAGGIDAAIANSQEQFSATMGTLKENSDTVTGGNAFCYLKIIIMRSRGTTPDWPITATVMKLGKYPLSSVVMTAQAFYPIAGGGRSGTRTPDINIGDLPSGDQKEIEPIVLPFKWRGDSIDIDIWFRAKNGYWHQLTLLRRVNFPDGTSAMLRATRVHRLDWNKGLERVLVLSKIDDEFPIQEIKWPKWIE